MSSPSAPAGRRPRRRPVRPAGTAPLSLALLLLAVLLAACASERPHAPPQGVERGVASWYGQQFHGRPTASGERYDMHQLTAAHRTLPFGTRLEVVNLDNGRSVVVRVNDRGPFHRGRVVDVSYAAARDLGLVGPGTARVELRALGAPAVATARYTVQVGAFQDPGRAAALRAELARRYPAVQVSTDGVWHRVRVGTYDGRPGAEKVRSELRRLGFTALVVPSS